MPKYDTNLAAEFYVLSMLHRLGIDALLTLGNKKGVDIAVARPGVVNATVEVKGVAGKFDWPANNIRVFDSDCHFYALVSFEGKIEDPAALPQCWVVPARDIQPFLRQYSNRVVVRRKSVVRDGARYHNRFGLITGEALDA